MTRLFKDFETRSCLDLNQYGLDRYIKHPSTQALMLSWAIDDGPVHLWQKHLDGNLPSELKDATLDPHVIKTAYNAPFEHAVLKYLLGIDVPYAQWLDVLIWSRHLSVTGTLEEVGQVFGLTNEAKMPWGTKKDPGEAQKLINMFCTPAIVGGDETLFGIREPWFHDWDTDPEEWARFCEYCKQDLISERGLLRRMETFPLPDSEQAAWELDQVINSRGLPCDLSLVNGSMGIATLVKTGLREQLKTLTNVENPNSNEQLLKWLQTQGYTFSGVGKPFVNRAMNGECELTEAARQVLEIRKQSSKTSDSKLEKIIDVVSSDGRLRNQFTFMGAARTGRWSALGGVQMHNLPRPTKAVSAKLDLAIDLLRDQDSLGIALEFPSPMDVVTSTLRSIFRASPGKKLLVCDLGAVENRVLGWMTGCDAINEVFRKGLDPYKAFGADLFDKAYDEITKQERQDAKPPVLGCGYQLSGGEEKTDEETGDKIFTGLMGYGRLMGIELSHELAHKSVKLWREKNDDVVQFWYKIQDAAIEAVRTKKPQEIGPFLIECFGSKLMRLTLPSGRGLHYIRPKIEKDERFKKDGVIYWGKDQKTKQYSWQKIYGGKWCLSAHTKILTNRGICSIINVLPTDLLWDGQEWVRHSGVIYQGYKVTGNWLGMEITSTHPILAGSMWKQSSEMDEFASRDALLSGLDSVRALLRGQKQENQAGPSLTAIAAEGLRSQLGKYFADRLNRVATARRRPVERNLSQSAATMLSKTQNCGTNGYGEERVSCLAAITPNVGCTPITGGAGSRCLKSGKTALRSGSNMPSLWKTGRTEQRTWTGLTTTETTRRETFASSRARKIATIDEKPSEFGTTENYFPTPTFAAFTCLLGAEMLRYSILSEERVRSGVWTDTKRQDVFDILNCGPRNRFTVFTDEGPTIVHNCENSDQAISRDLLVNGMMLAEKKGIPIIGHTHDELIAEVDKDSKFGLDDLRECMIQPPAWAPDLILDAEGYETDGCYRKD